ncbi:hypothetical protein [Actinokineospora enzanensis]|uniref:hypothetical protein n=1 Tax=Actinokineospora enzanensis TaxID=155975 RepID=UPI0003808807|nr:hypothetical protein [Actinokineospora enzanensis]
MDHPDPDVLVTGTATLVRADLTSAGLSLNIYTRTDDGKVGRASVLLPPEAADYVRGILKARPAAGHDVRQAEPDAALT